MRRRPPPAPRRPPRQRTPEGGEASTTPAEVAKRVIRGVLHREVSEERTEQLLPAMKLAPPIWEEHSPSTIAPDLGFHLVYGVGVAAAFNLVERRPTRRS